MTTGWEALAEAARLETARVYANLQHEHKTDDTGEVSDRGDNVIRLAPPRDYGAA